jgi:hypothetical protein
MMVIAPMFDLYQYKQVCGDRSDPPQQKNGLEEAGFMFDKLRMRQKSQQKKIGDLFLFFSIKKQESVVSS